MKRILFTLLVAAPVLTWAQANQLKPLTSTKAPAKPDTLITTDKTNPQLKHFVVTYNDLPREQGNLVKGLKEGIWKTYYDNGSPKAVQEYHNGKLNGTSITFDRSSFIMADETYVDGKLEGLAIQYHNGGKIKTQATYKNGLLNGKKIVNYDDGSRQEESYWKDGKKDGLTKWFYQGGKPAGEYNYSMDKINGKSILYNTSGKVIKEGSFVNGYEEGEWKEYDPSGETLVKRITYKEGKIISEEQLATPVIENK